MLSAFLFLAVCNSLQMKKEERERQSTLVAPTGEIITQQISFICRLHMGGLLSPAPLATPRMFCADASERQTEKQSRFPVASPLHALRVSRQGASGDKYIQLSTRG